MIQRTAYALTLGLLFIAPSGAFAQDVSSCATTVTAGVLTTDLDCSSSPFGVAIVDGGSLDLAGHTLIGGYLSGVTCGQRCSIEGGGGTISGSGGQGVRNFHRRGEVTASNVNILDNALYGILAYRSVVVTNSVISGNGMGIYTRRTATVSGSTLNDNESQAIRSDNRIFLTGSTISGSGVGGLFAKKITADSSVVEQTTASHEHCLTFPGECVDIASVVSPLLTSVTCETSADLRRGEGGTYQASGESWLACSLD